MRWKQTFIPTLRQVPGDAEAASHKLMLKAGYIRKLSSGVYSYLPLGFRVLRNICSIIREEMTRAGAEELLLPALHPAELWKKTGRYDALGEDKIHFVNRSGQEFVLGPTHEEVITELVGSSVQSYQDLPLALYQIQTKFRDELRPRFGVVRTKEFIMKDAYSFHRDEADLDKTYQAMREAYQRIFSRSGIKFQIVSADPGIMGGRASDEFMVICPYGEDHIAVCEKCQTAVSRDIAFRAIDEKKASRETQPEKRPEAFDTPGLKTIAELTDRFGLKPRQMVKTILYEADGKSVAACVSGASEVNETKLRKLLGCQELKLASPERIEKLTGASVGFSGPVGLKGVFITADAELLDMSDFVTGANQNDRHLRNVNLSRDFKADLIGDIRHVQEGDRCPKCLSAYELVTAMEVGHVFKLGTRYSKALEANFRDDKGNVSPIIMGCYGIGVNRIMAACIEEHHDEKGIVWPASIAPFQVEILTLNESHEESVKIAVRLEKQLSEASIEALYDDRAERAGVKFNDADLIGIPVQIIVSERNLAKQQIEIKTRSNQASLFIGLDEAVSAVRKLLAGTAGGN